MALAKYIQYSLDFTYVHETLGRGQEIHSTPVNIGCRARQYTKMTSQMWRDLQRGKKHEFAINETLAQMGDVCLVGKVNHFRGQVEVRDALKELLREARVWVMEITREVVAVEQDLVECKNRLKLRTPIKRLKTGSGSPFHTPPSLPTPLSHPPNTPL